ncbi:MAG: hypothetical protein Q9178_006605 [Gyalolechia marmorata]
MEARELSEPWNRQAGPYFDLAILVLAVVNVAAACGIIATIFYDALVLAKSRSLSKKPKERIFLRGLSRVVEIHPAEALPLATSIAIAIQGIIYVAVQSIGLDTLLANCESTAKVVWPALWIAPYTIFVFGLDTGARSLQGKRFPAQSRLSLLVCIVAILVAVLLTWIPSYIFPSQDLCLATLVWWTTKYANIGLTICSGILFTNAVCALVITSQLMRTVDIAHNQRIAASRAVYYLVVSASLMTLIVPFFAQRTLQKNALRAAWVAEVSLNLFGLITFILHILLRSNADRMAIQPLEGTRRVKKRLKFFGPSDLEMTLHTPWPVDLQKEKCQYTDDTSRSMTAPRTDVPLAASEAEREASQNADLMNEIVAEYSRPVRSPPPVLLLSHTPGKRSCYSIFPTFRSAMLRNSTSTTFSQDVDTESLSLPKLLASSNHKREISEQTSATVQIGFRLSSLSKSQRLTPPSATASSCCLPVRGISGSSNESPPIRPLSSRPGNTRTISDDSVNLPLQPHQPVRDVDESRLEFLVPDWNRPRKSSSRTRLKSARPMTMKALPPIPSIDCRLSPPDDPMPNGF